MKFKVDSCWSWNKGAVIFHFRKLDSFLLHFMLDVNKLHSICIDNFMDLRVERHNVALNASQCQSFWSFHFWHRAGNCSNVRIINLNSNVFIAVVVVGRWICRNCFFLSFLNFFPRLRAKRAGAAIIRLTTLKK